MQNIVIINSTNNNVFTNLYSANNAITAYNYSQYSNLVVTTISPNSILSLSGTITTNLNAYLFDGNYIISPTGNSVAGSSYLYQVGFGATLSTTNLDGAPFLNDYSGLINSASQCSELYACQNGGGSNCQGYQQSQQMNCHSCRNCPWNNNCFDNCFQNCSDNCTVNCNTPVPCWIQCVSSCFATNNCQDCDSICNSVPYGPLSSFCTASCAGASKSNPVCGPVNGSNFAVPTSISYSNNTYVIVVGESGAPYGSLISTDNTATNSFIAIQTGAATFDVNIVLPYSLSTFFGKAPGALYLEIDCLDSTNTIGFGITTTNLPPVTGGSVSTYPGSSVSGTISITAGSSNATTLITGVGLQMSSGSLSLNGASATTVYLSEHGNQTQVAQFGNLLFKNY